MHNLHPQQCDYDRIEVFSRLGEEKVNKHGVYCGSKAPTPVTSDGNVLRVVFSSDTSIQKTGFAAVFFTGSGSETSEFRVNIISLARLRYG